LLGYLLANILSAWERQRFVESVLVSNGFMAVLRLDLADELDRLSGDLAAISRAVENIQSQSAKPSEPAGEIRARLMMAARRTEAIKTRYANTAAEDDLLRRLFRDKLTRMFASERPGFEREPAPAATPPLAPESAGTRFDGPRALPEDSTTGDAQNGGTAAKP
jgi:hypothetical protein